MEGFWNKLLASKEKILYLLFIPWFLQVFAFIPYAFNRLHLKEVFTLNDFERSYYFARINYPGLDSDFFALLVKAQAYIFIDKRNFSLVLPNEKESNLPEEFMRHYAQYWFNPAQMEEYSEEKPAKVILYFRMKPPRNKNTLQEKLDYHQTSYIVVNRD